MGTALQQVAKRLAVSEQELQSIVINTVMPNGGKQVTNDQFVSFMAVANEYQLNPLTKEIYAFPAKGGGIQPIVSIDGWLKIINGHPDFNGMVFEDIREGSELIAITCKIFKKGIEHPVTVTEYMAECKQPNKEPWQKWPSRMLRHKAAIQAGRYAFGLSGIIDPDEADRYKETGAIQREEKDITPEESLPELTQEMFNKKANGWANTIQGGMSPENLLNMAKSKFTVSDEIAEQILNLTKDEANA